MYIGIDVGGTNIRIASFKSIDSRVFEDCVKLKTINDYERGLTLITQNILNLTKKKINGIGIGVPAVLNSEKTRIKMANNLKGWNGRYIKRDLEEAFKCRVVLENDATAAATGEAFFGQGINKDFLFITWGTGIGGAFVKKINNHIYSQFSELGHQIIELNGLQDTCGQKGCLEAYCGGLGIENNYKKKAEHLTDKEWHEVEQQFTQGIINIIAIHPIDVIIFAGGIALNHEKEISNIQLLLKDKLKIVRVPQLILSSLKENIGVYGAFACLKI